MPTGRKPSIAVTWRRFLPAKFATFFCFAKHYFFLLTLFCFLSLSWMPLSFFLNEELRHNHPTYYLPQNMYLPQNSTILKLEHCAQYWWNVLGSLASHRLFRWFLCEVRVKKVQRQQYSCGMAGITHDFPKGKLIKLRKYTKKTDTS